MLVDTRDGVCVCVGVAFRFRALRRRPKRVLSRLNTQPAGASVNASPAVSPPPAHDSRSAWFATLSLWGSFIPDFLPVYPGAFALSLMGPSLALQILAPSRGLEYPDRGWIAKMEILI